VIASLNVAWYVSRAGGLVGFGLVTLAVVAGIVLAGRASFPGWPRFAVEDVHRFLGLLAGAFLSIHVLALLADHYLGFTLLQLALPGISPYRPLPTALGVVAAELLLALALTNRFRRAIPYRVWRRAHGLNFAVWGLALGHGLSVGTDSDTRWALAVYVASAASVAAAGAWRLLGARRAPAWAVALWTGTAGIVSAELVVALALGPLVRR
jgi:methionine sulfoxide reductase heme-binding subunit